MTLAMYLCTTNDRNGNPRRGWVIFDAYPHNVGGVRGGCSSALAWVDEGYSGAAALREAFHDAVELPQVYVTPTEWRDWRKAAQAAEKESA